MKSDTHRKTIFLVLVVSVSAAAIYISSKFKIFSRADVSFFFKKNFNILQFLMLISIVLIFTFILQSFFVGYMQTILEIPLQADSEAIRNLANTALNQEYSGLPDFGVVWKQSFINSIKKVYNSMLPSTVLSLIYFLLVTVQQRYAKHLNPALCQPKNSTT